jgi:hypothetical protein
MQISIYPAKKYRKCLVLVGGSGDTVEGFTPLVTKLSERLIDYSICTFNFSTKVEAGSLLDKQAQELEVVLNELVTKHNFIKVDIFCTSQGAYATVKSLSSHKLDNHINNIILYDPADYYLSEIDLHSWSGSSKYLPSKTIVSDELQTISGNMKVHVIHLTLRNYGLHGYLQKEFKDREFDDPSGYPRLNTKMIEAFYAKIPPANKGKYIELSGVPHAILRDGNIATNISTTIETIHSFLNS